MIRTRWSRAAAAVFVAFAACVAVTGVAACQDLLAISGPVVVAPIDGGSAELSACGVTVGSSACETCVERSCCPQAQACRGSSSCATYEDCLVPCGSDYACRAQCFIAHPVATSEVAAMDQCVAAECGAPCGVQCGNTASYTAPDAAVGCQSCLAESACTQLEACGADVDCTSIDECTAACVTEDCLYSCPNGRDAGLFFAYLLGAGSSCREACELGSNWTCVGHVSAPLDQAPQNSVTLGFADQASSAPIVGATVKACAIADVPCAAPLVTGATDSAGRVTLVVDQPAGSLIGFDGYFDISSPSTVPTLIFLMFPLTAPKFDAAVPFTLLTPAILANEYSLAGVTEDATRGALFPTAADCHWAPAAGVTMAADGIDSATHLFYVSGGNVSRTATATDSSGAAVFLNAPATSITVTQTPLAVGHVVAGATVFVRAGSVSLLAMHPNL